MGRVIGRVVINGKEIPTQDKASISVTGDMIFVNGQPYGDEKLSGIVKIEIHGAVGDITSKANVEVTGEVTGSIDCNGGCVVNGSVGGNIDAGENVKCGNVGGDVDASGDVNCGDVSGGIDAGGDVVVGKVGGAIDAGGSVRCG